MTQWSGMRALLAAGLIVASAAHPAARAQQSTGATDPVAVFTEHPRLFLRPARLRLLKREHERNSPRWQQLESYVAGDAPMPESAFAQALDYQVSGNAAAGRKAVAWALDNAKDLRQLALVFDWCQPLLSESERSQLAGLLTKQMTAETGDSVSAVRSRVLAAIALYDHVPDLPNRELQSVVHGWWAKIAPALSAGNPVISRDHAYSLWEILHAIRDNTNLDLRESASKFFGQFPIEHLMSHYPAAFRGEDNDFRIGFSAKAGEPDLHAAMLSRAAELAMVAFDSNAQESQYLQGWLMHDNFALRGPAGAPYEFLWANPYQPGLSFTLLPLVFHDAALGAVYVRSSWDDSAEWFGYADGAAQIFRDGRLERLEVSSARPLDLGGATIYFGAASFRIKPADEDTAVVLVGLKPNSVYQIEIDDEEVFEEAADRGGILLLDPPHTKETGVRLRLAPGSR